MKAIKELMNIPCDRYTRWWYKTFMGIENATMETHIKCNITVGIITVIAACYGAYQMPEFKDWFDKQKAKIEIF